MIVAAAIALGEAQGRTAPPFQAWAASLTDALTDALLRCL